MTAWALEHDMLVRRLGSGPRIVWLHGLGESSLAFDAIANHAQLAGFTHVLPDLPGYGRSPWPDRALSLDALADRVALLLTHHAPAIVIGHSMGGVLATLVAERAPVRAVVDIDGNLSRGDCRFSGRAAAYELAAFVAHGFDEQRAQIYADAATSPALRRYHAALCFASPEQFHRQACDLVAISATEQLAPRLAALRAPSLFIAGVPDGVCEASRALLDHHRVRWVGIAPAGHWVYADQPDRFATELARFIAGV